MISLNKWHYFVLFLALSIIILPFVNFFSQEPFKLDTSVWCFRGSRETNFCKFKNICYDPQFKAFLFFLSENSVIKGFDHYSKLQKIELSSVQGHNQFYANISIIDVKNYELSKKINIHSKIMLLSRFKPNNIMHIIHDDLFPLFLTLESVCLGDTQCMENYGLVFHDSNPKGPFFYLYELFSKLPPILLNQVVLNSNLMCFKEMVTGLVQEGVVYQYGFKKPHGPIKPIYLTQNDVLRFTSYVKNKLKISSQINSTPKIILLSREKNRKILNVQAVKKMIKNVYHKLDKKINLVQINLNLFSNDIKTLLNIISHADGLIGMHGAEMILSLFLKKNSYVFEIFPFGINPEVVSFIRPISEVNGCNFIYFSWKSLLKNNSVSHPNAPPMFGGISHLNETMQKKIKKAKEVPPVVCCNDPLFLYHMFQDTLVSDDFEDFFYKSVSRIIFHKTQSEKGETIKKWFYPYIVFKAICIFHSPRNFLYISWGPPFNVQNNEDLVYSLYIRDQKDLFVKTVLTQNTSLELKTPIGVEPEFQVWIRVYFSSNTFRSPDLYVNCY